MPISVNYFNKGSLLKVAVKHDDIDGFKKLEVLFYKILISCFLHKDVMMITLQPQKYSFGFELDSEHQILLKQFNALVNKITNCDDDFLYNVSYSDEFKRGLLVLLLNKGQRVETFVKELVTIKLNIENLETQETVIACENDGDTLLLFNTGLAVGDVQALEHD